MDFDSLTRRDLQFFCKKNKIPANMTNIAMADALKALEIVEGVEEFMNQAESTRDLSPTSVAKNMPSAARTAARTTRRKTKDETQPSELVTRSCLVTSKSLAGEMEQENKNTNVVQDQPSLLPPSRRRGAVAMNLEESKTPAVRSTRRAQAAASESVQRVYSTRRAVKLLEESMADLSLKTNVPSKKKEDAESEEAKSEDNSEKTQEGEAISVRDLNDSWDDSKNDPDVDVLYGDLGDITFFDATTTSKEQMNGTESNTVPASESSVLVEDQETSQDHAASNTTKIVTCSEESESEEMKNDDDDDDDDDDDSGGVADTNQEAFGSKVSASDNVNKVETVPTVLLAEETEESCETDELMDDETKVAIVSDKKTQASSPQESDSDEWSDYEISEIDEKSLKTGEMIDSESEEASFSDKKTSASSSSVLAGKETKTPLDSPFETESNEPDLKLNLLADNKETVEEEMVLDNYGEREAEAETKKKKNIIDEESLKDVSIRQLTKLVKELAIKNKQQHKSLE